MFWPVGVQAKGQWLSVKEQEGGWRERAGRRMAAALGQRCWVPALGGGWLTPHAWGSGFQLRRVRTSQASSRPAQGQGAAALRFQLASGSGAGLGAAASPPRGAAAWTAELAFYPEGTSLGL